MTWGTFTPTHIATLALGVLASIILFYAIKNQSRKRQILVLFLLSLVCVAAVVYNILTGASPLESLPLTLYGLNMLLLPFAVLFRSKWLCNLLLLWSVGSWSALIVNGAIADVKLASVEFFVYFLSHLIGAAIPLILFTLRLVNRDFRTVKTTMIITVATYVAVHFINVAINTSGLLAGGVTVNYLASLAPTNGLFNIFYLLIPSPFWYMVLCIPVLILYLGWWYFPELLEDRKRRKNLRKKLRAVDQYFDEYEEEYIEEIIRGD